MLYMARSNFGKNEIIKKGDEKKCLEEKENYKV